MSKRVRGNGDGTVYRQKADGRWVASIHVIDPKSGKKKRVKEYFHSKGEAKTRLIQLASEIKTYKPNVMEEYTLAEWLKKWLPANQKPKCTTNVYHRKLQLLRYHVEQSKIGNTPISELKKIDIQEFYLDLQKYGLKQTKKDVDGNIVWIIRGGLSSQTVLHIHNMINPALRDAFEEGFIRRNPAEKLAKGKDKLLKNVKTRKIRVLYIDEVTSYLNQLVNHRLYVLFVLELCTGLRRGELIGLQWPDFNIDTHELSINRAVQRVQNEDAPGSHLEYTDLKSEAAHRVIKLPLLAYNALLEHMEQQEAEKMAAGKGYCDERLIFCTPIGTMLEPRRVYALHCNALNDAELPHTAFHNMRHTVATLLLERGESAKSIQELLGHADIRTTLNTYAHVLEKMKTATSEMMNDIMKDVIPEFGPGESPNTMIDPD